MGNLYGLKSVYLYRMMLKFKHTGFRFLAAILILSVVTLNIPFLLNCSKLVTEGDCCHIQNTVKPCCIKNLKITSEERLSGNCGCSMKESQQAADMFTDLQFGSTSKIQKTQFAYEIINSVFDSNTGTSKANEYSPPNFTSIDVYLSNLNLRI